MIATAIGAVAVGAFAIGALAVGRSAASWSGTPNSNHLRFRTSPWPDSAPPRSWWPIR